MAMKRPNNLAILLACIFLLAGNLGSCSKTVPASPAEIATKFVTSLNQKNMETLASLSAMPLKVRQHDWESAKDGVGFVLGKATDINLVDQAQIKKYFSDPVMKMAVVHDLPDDTSLSLLQEELKGSEKQWAGLSMHIFRRGMGDVEHIFVVGVNGDGMVAAVYSN